MNIPVPKSSALSDLLTLMARLRDPEKGCPWDIEQTFASVAPYTLEEAYEVADAIHSGDPDKLREELGDLLFQVVFHARMAQERGWFDFEDVARTIHDKLVRRHPHVFPPAATAATTAADQASQAPSTPAAVLAGWEQTKAQEREALAAKKGQGPAGVLDDVPRALPALTRAHKLSKRAARVGFDWTDPADVRAKVDEELAELDEALHEASGQASAHAVEELGDVLFALVNWARHVGADPEEALRGTNAKFERRFGFMEGLARARGLELTCLSLDAWEHLWQEAKAAERVRGRPQDDAVLTPQPDPQHP